MSINNKQLSIVIPVYNGEKTLLELHERLTLELRKISNSYEVIYVDDASTDNSFEILSKIHKKDKNSKVIKLSTNFGQHNATMCGFSYARGDIVVTLDDDLQIQPEDIPKLIKKLKKEDFDVVYGEYSQKRHSILRNFGSNIIQLIYKKIFSVKGNLTSFRVVRKRIINEILQYNKNYTFVDGLIAWHTKSIGYEKVSHQARSSGRSGYSIAKLLFLSLNMITNFSVFPLQLASIAGFIFSLFGFIIGAYMLFVKLRYGIPVTGFASLFVAVTFFSGIQLITIGVIGEYVGRIYQNINQKPQYSVKKELL